VAAEGRGDARTAVSAYREAAENGEAPAQFALGRLYLDGRGTQQDYAQALAWLGKAASQGNPGAEYELAVMREKGLGTPPDVTAAAQWFLKSAGSGYAPAEIGLADMFDHGVGVAKDLDQAIYWSTAAARQGEVAGQLEAGRLYVEAARQVQAPVVRLGSSQFRSVMDKVFGAGNWVETSGYRAPAKEDQLRAEGAGTVAQGMLSRHSLGTPRAPGAYDVVVAHMSITDAASKLLGSGVRFRRVFPEGAHGNQGPHLHVEPLLGDVPSATVATPSGGLIDEVLSGVADESLPAHERNVEQARYWLGLAAHNGSADALAILATLPPADGGAR
jgi:TPR repeat protein